MTNDQIELIAKVIGVIGSVIALYKAYQEIVLSRKSRLREEFKFIKDFIGDLKAETHPILVEKGFLAICGDPHLSAAEIRYLLSLRSPSTALRRYLQGREHLVFTEDPTEGSKKIDFKSSLKSKSARHRWKLFYFIAYIITAMLAFIPVFFTRFLAGSNWQLALILVGMFLLSFGWLAVFSLIAGSKISRAEALVLQQ